MEKKKKILISTDTTADLSREMLKQRGIKVTPLHVLLGEKEYLDGVNIIPEQIFEFVKNSKKLPKTSAVSMGEYLEFFENNLREYDEIIHFCISSEASASYTNALLANEEVNNRVHLIDSRHLSAGQGLLVMKACDLKDEGKSADEIEEEIKRLIPLTQTSFVVDTMEYLHKGGRCSSLARFATMLLSIHPSIQCLSGKLGTKKMYRGKLLKCIEKYIDDLAEEYQTYDDTRVFITHSSCTDDIVDAAYKMVKEKFHFKKIEVTVAGSVVTSHCGRGTLGVLFITK